MFLIASFSYALSIFIDVFSYHLKYYIQDSKNVRYLLSLINIFQYSARAFVLVFVPIMAYLTEEVKDKDEVWFVTFMAHICVVVVLLPLFSHRFTLFLSIKVITVLNRVFGKAKVINLKVIGRHQLNEQHDKISNNFSLIVTSYFAGFLFSISITFLYYLSFSFPQKALMLSSLTQIINMAGSLLLVLFIDPRIMTSIDNGSGYYEIKILTASRTFVHITLIVILLVLKWI